MGVTAIRRVAGANLAYRFLRQLEVVCSRKAVLPEDLITS